MSRRGWIAVAVLASWVVGLGLLVRRELFRPDVERFAAAGMRVTPGATFFAVTREGRHIGFASSTIDTAETGGGIRIVDYLVADLPVDGRLHRASARTTVRLSRGFRLQRFQMQVEAEQGPVNASGVVEGDSAVVMVLHSGADAAPDTQRVRIPGPVLLPTLVPLAVALGETPDVGREYRLPVFDPVALSARTVTLRIAAETLFVMHDSATFDSTRARWAGALPDTVRAWQVVSADSVPDATSFTGWVDAQGRVVRTTQLGTLTLERRPYELAFENWQLDKRTGAPAPVDPNEDILESTAIAADIRAKKYVDALQVRLRGVDLSGFDIASERQTLAGDTLTIIRERISTVVPGYVLGRLGQTREMRDQWRPYLRQEPLIESADPEIRRLALALRGGVRDPKVVAERINRWVHDSLAKRTTFGIPSARAVLAARAGDCNEHTQLYVALARAANLPARVAAGLVHVNGRFYYHAWPEVYLGSWVAVDPTLGQFPADAAHLRFVVGGLGRQAELLRLIGNLDIDVLDAR